MNELGDMLTLLCPGVLVLAGHYESEPNQVYFEHKYIDEGGQWKLVGFNIEMK